MMLDTTISLGDGSILLSAGSISLGAGSILQGAGSILLGAERSHVLMGVRSWYMYVMYMRGSIGVCSNLDWRTKTANCRCHKYIMLHTHYWSNVTRR